MTLLGNYRILAMFFLWQKIAKIIKNDHFGQLWPRNGHYGPPKSSKIDQKSSKIIKNHQKSSKIMKKRGQIPSYYNKNLLKDSVIWPPFFDDFCRFWSILDQTPENPLFPDFGPPPPKTVIDFYGGLTCGSLNFAKCALFTAGTDFFCIFDRKVTFCGGFGPIFYRKSRFRPPP
jgi:hypothetical protein